VGAGGDVTLSGGRGGHLGRSRTIGMEEAEILTASVELSCKIVDNEERLRATLAHELCHVAQWVVQREAKPPHGGAFRLWASRVEAYDPTLVSTLVCVYVPVVCPRAIATTCRMLTYAHVCSRNLPLQVVSTCHSYDIKYKFQYKCQNCGHGYGRHTRSINVEAQSCGHCHGRLEVPSPTNA
jgi:predicted SprT family Zn-dependent metalloprotease